MEIDEDKHDTYSEICERNRIIELQQDLAEFTPDEGFMLRPIVMVRINPDAYKTQEGVRVPSCWVYNKLHVFVVPKERQKEWEHRLQVLFDTIQYHIDSDSVRDVEIVELFYE